MGRRSIPGNRIGGWTDPHMRRSHSPRACTGVSPIVRHAIRTHCLFADDHLGAEADVLGPGRACHSHASDKTPEHARDLGREGKSDLQGFLASMSHGEPSELIRVGLVFLWSRGTRAPSCPGPCGCHCVVTLPVVPLHRTTLTCRASQWRVARRYSGRPLGTRPVSLAAHYAPTNYPSPRRCRPPDHTTKTS